MGLEDRGKTIKNPEKSRPIALVLSRDAVEASYQNVVVLYIRWATQRHELGDLGRILQNGRRCTSVVVTLTYTFPMLNVDF